MMKIGGNRRVTRVLNRYLRALLPGDALPSVRTLVKECQVSAATVGSVVQGYEQAGLVQVRPQQGMFVHSKLTCLLKKQVAVKQIDVIYIGSYGSGPLAPAIRQDLIWHLGEEPTRRGYHVRFHSINEGKVGIDQIAELASSDSCESAVVVHLGDLAHLEPLTEAKVPFVCVYPESPSLPFGNCALIDQDCVVKQQLNCLMDLGHRHIGYLHNVDRNCFYRSHLLRREAFYKMALDFGLPINSSFVQFSGTDQQVQQEAIERLLALPVMPTAMICNDEHLPELYRVLKRRGLKIGYDISIVGVNDGPEAEMVSPAATTLRIPRKIAVNIALDLLEETFKRASGMASNHYVEVKLVERESTGPIRSS